MYTQATRAPYVHLYIRKAAPCWTLIGNSDTMAVAQRILTCLAVVEG